MIKVLLSIAYRDKERDIWVGREATISRDGNFLEIVISHPTSTPDRYRIDVTELHRIIELL